MDDAKRLLKKALYNLYRVVEDPEFWTPAFCREFFEWCDAQAYEAPDSVLVRGQLALDLARKTGDVHTMVKAHGVMASAYRRASVLARCDSEIQTALRMARSCPCCLSETYRRLGGMLLFQERFQEAKGCLNKAIAFYRELGDEDGVGRTLISRGAAFWKLGDIDAALDDERRALELLAIETPEFFYLAALTNTAAFLATGEDRHFAQAEPFLNEVRDQLAGMKDVTAVRICLSWIHGLILARLGERKRALQMLRKVRRRLLNRRQDAEVVAVTADLSSLYCDTRRFRHIKRLTEACLNELRNISGLRPLLERVVAAAERGRDETRQSLAELREAVPVSVPALYKTPPLASITAP